MSNKRSEFLTREKIKQFVVEKLQAITDENQRSKDEASRLYADLGMGPIVRQAMAIPYSKIALSYPNGIRVTMVDSGKCILVKDCIDLVFNRAQGIK